MALRSKMIDKQIAILKASANKKVETGWFSTDRYAGEGQLAGRSVAEVARLNEFGGTIKHPGGTKYITDAVVNQKFVGSRFVSSKFEGEHKITGPSVIVIPARPFMRLAESKFRAESLKIQMKIASKLIHGSINPQQAMEQIGLAMQGCIVDSIKNGGWVPNAASTIAKKGFDKPLIDSSHMWKTVNSKVS
jgi:hypothetical protein